MTRYQKARFLPLPTLPAIVHDKEIWVREGPPRQGLNAVRDRTHFYETDMCLPSREPLVVEQQTVELLPIFTPCQPHPTIETWTQEQFGLTVPEYVTAMQWKGNP